MPPPGLCRGIRSSEKYVRPECQIIDTRSLRLRLRILSPLPIPRSVLRPEPIYMSSEIDPEPLRNQSCAFRIALHFHL